MNPATSIVSRNQLRVERVFRPSRLAPRLLATAYEIVLPIAPRPLQPLPTRQPSTRITPPRPVHKDRHAAAQA